MLHRHGCNYRFSLHFPTGARVAVRGWFCGGYISRLLGHHPQGEPGRVPGSQHNPGQHFLKGVHSSMWCHGRDRWSREPRRNAAAWDAGRMQLCGESQGAPWPDTGDRVFTGKGAPAARQFGMSPLLDYRLPKQMPHREPEGSKVKTESLS